MLVQRISLPSYFFLCVSCGYLGTLTEIFTIRKLVLQSHDCVQTSPPGQTRTSTAYHLLANRRNLSPVFVIHHRPVSKKVCTVVGLCCRFGWVSELRKMRGQCSFFTSLFYFIRLLHNTCYKLLTTFNE
jgi:hypothetical protein